MFEFSNTIIRRNLFITFIAVTLTQQDLDVIFKHGIAKTYIFPDTRVTVLGFINFLIFWVAGKFLETLEAELAKFSSEVGN